MNTSTVAILGCAKNCMPFIHKSVHNMCIIGSMFKDYKIIIFENDSSDGTDMFLQEIKQKQTQVSIITHPYCKNKYRYRTWCIAYGRQRCADALKSSGFNPDYVIVMDLDDVGARGNAQEVIQLMMHKNQFWDIAFPRPTYDLWALRFPGHTINFIESSHILQKLYKTKPLNELQYELKLYNKYKLELREYINNKKNYDSNSLLSVYSSFNGIAIYKYEFFKKGTYSGKNLYYSRVPNPNDRYLEECEHVNFHKSIGPCRRKIVSNAWFVR